MIQVIRQSMLGVWLRCGVQFERRYLNGEIIPPGIAARRGSSVHKAAETNNIQKMSTGIDLPLSDLQDAARDEYVRLLKHEGVFIPKTLASEKTSLINDNLNKAVRSTEVYHKEVAPTIQPLYVEREIEVDIGLDLPIGGRLDLITTGRVRDTKVFGASKNQAWADSEVQPDFYWLLHKKLMGEEPENFLYDAIVALKDKSEYKPLTTVRKHAQERLRVYCGAFLRDLESGIFRPADPASWVCSLAYCGYYQTCRYTRR
jgi:hypothetical protein